MVTPGATVTACNPGGQPVTGTYLGPVDDLPGFGWVEWVGPGVLGGARTHRGRFPLGSMLDLVAHAEHPCRAMPDDLAWECTLPAGHDGPHVASDGLRVVASW